MDKTICSPARCPQKCHFLDTIHDLNLNALKQSTVGFKLASCSGLLLQAGPDRPLQLPLDPLVTPDVKHFIHARLQEY